jgi:hypothetical protein
MHNAQQRSITMQNEERINVLEGKLKELEEVIRAMKMELPPAVLRAESFIVEDPMGNELVQISSDDGTGFIKTADSDGHTLTEINSTNGGRGLIKTSDNKGKDIVTLTSTIDGEGVIVTTNGNGEELVSIATNRNGEGLIEIMDGKGNGIISDMNTTSQCEVKSINIKNDKSRKYASGLRNWKNWFSVLST